MKHDWRFWPVVPKKRIATFAPEVFAAVAELPIGTVRELLGALNRLIAQQAVQGARLTAAEAIKLLAVLGHVKPEPPRVTPDAPLAVPGWIRQRASDGAASAASPESRRGWPG